MGILTDEVLDDYYEKNPIRIPDDDDSYPEPEPLEETIDRLRNWD